MLFCAGAAAALQAAPALRLTQTAFGPLPVAQGANGPTQVAGAYNVGSGSLNLTLTASDSWLVPTLGGAGPCENASLCLPVQIALKTASLAKGAYTGTVTVSDPNAVDAPQTITVTVDVGGNVPDNLTLYAAPNSTVTSTFYGGQGAGASATTQSGGPWLSVVGASLGSFQFTVPFTVTANTANLAAGDYHGTVNVGGSSLAADNKAVAVTLHVTTQPIAQPSSTNVTFNIAQGAAKQLGYVVLSNSGQGTLTISSATATAASGNWLSAQTSSNVITLTADPTNLSPGNYPGTLTIASNAVNSPTTVPVTLTVAPAGPPQISFGGVVNVFTNNPADGISQGDVLAIYGRQFTAGEAQTGTLPLTTNFSNVQVMLNGQAIPVQYVGAGQINVQIPYDAPIGGGTLNVVAGGKTSNTVSVNILPLAPVLLPFPGGTYVLAQTASGGFEGYSSTAPAHAGDTLVLYAVGLGAVSPASAAGAAAPSKPLANVAATTKICMGNLNPFAGGATCIAPFFAGLTPGYFGLYQLNFVVPQGIKGTAIPFFLQVGQSSSNILSFSIQ